MLSKTQHILLLEIVRSKRIVQCFAAGLARIVILLSGVPNLTLLVTRVCHVPSEAGNCKNTARAAFSPRQ